MTTARLYSCPAPNFRESAKDNPKPMFFIWIMTEAVSFM